MRVIIFIIGFLLNSLALFSQNTEWIYWQKDKPLTFQDYKGAVGACGPEIVDDSIKIEVSACLGLWSVLDIPKSWKKGVEYEKFYFVPCFQRE